MSLPITKNAWGYLGAQTPEDIAKMKSLPFGRFKTKYAKRNSRLPQKTYTVTVRHTHQTIETIEAATFDILADKKTISNLAWVKYNELLEKGALMFHHEHAGRQVFDSIPTMTPSISLGILVAF